MLAVAVRFDLREGGLEAFRAALLSNAAATRREPGCRQFDVAFSEDRRRCFLYEVYDDRAAFDAHHDTAHFRAFADASAPLYRDKQVETFVLHDR
jgi:quinol monooxygenase YgiN